MKQFFKFCAANYAFVILLIFFVLMAPDAYPGEPPLRGGDAVFSRMADCLLWIVVVETFAFPLERLNLLWLGLLVGPACWASTLVYAQRLWRVHRQSPNKALQPTAFGGG